MVYAYSVIKIFEEPYTSRVIPTSFQQKAIFDRSGRNSYYYLKNQNAWDFNNKDIKEGQPTLCFGEFIST